ncbi:aldehyde dehydrogenase family protein [Pirellulaceae bacterium]|jgi:vanillin dehydrogenase|nr:aldehyde dehydrogenase family protein [Pirellulaceae bacterium]
MYHHWIGGEFVKGANGQTFDDLNPSTDAVYAKVTQGTSDDIVRAVEAAHQAFLSYRLVPPSQREEILIRAADLLQQHQAEFIEILLEEIGSPISKARKEMSTATAYLRASAGATRRVTGKTLPTDIPGRLSFSVRHPIGVVAGITPFNVPLIKCIKHAAMPLATGNTVVLLPSEEAPVIAHRIGQLFKEAGLPAGAFNVVTGNGYDIGDALTTHPLIKMVGFTGSSSVGKHIQALCGKLGKRCVLELGGKNALVLLKDGNLDQAVTASVVGSFLFQGQICMSSSRIFVEKPLFEPFVEKLIQAAKHLGIGNLSDPKTMIGPIINPRQRERVRNHIRDAKSKGAILHTGGDWTDHCCRPTIFSNVGSDCLLYNEETFGPVTAIYPVDSADHAISLVNESCFGLSASIFTNHLELAMRFADNVNAGMVHINGTTIQDEPHVPFGGVGASGFGREGTDISIEDLTEWKWITMQHKISS